MLAELEAGRLPTRDLRSLLRALSDRYAYGRRCVVLSPKVASMGSGVELSAQQSQWYVTW